MQPGIFAKTFPGRDPQTVLAAVRDAGFAAAQYNLACSGLPSMPEHVPEGTAAALVAAAGTTGVRLAALSGTGNMAHPDAAHRKAVVRQLRAVIGCAAQAGIPMVTLCTGTREAEDQWRFHPDNATPEAWADMRATMAEACDLAGAAGVLLGIEPEHANVVRTLDDALRLAQELRTDRLRIVLDPANLFEVGPAPDMARAVAAAAPLLGLVHAKDRGVDGRVMPPGDGAVDFPALFASLRAEGYRGAVITHGIDLPDVPQTARRLRDWLA
ncbi:sugar phosphate isomerase/epimerase [Cereibacter sp. SYSU M97828]|nr:sugar phosphate isomerase/epimerase [Cereibacter flavus]